jgi:predicted 2-oxoglutarate/Fe(II)-dependent dioxygenase YbiX
MDGWRTAGDVALDTRVLNLSPEHEVTQMLAARSVSFAQLQWPYTAGRITFAEAAVVRYSVGAKVPPHTDTNYAKRERIFSFIAYLTEGYIGGDLVIPSLSYAGTQPKGHSVFFPSSELHHATDVVAGDKSVIVGFLKLPELTA